MRALLLIVCGALAVLAFRALFSPYGPLEPIITPAGIRYEVYKLPDDCEMVPGTCVSRFVFISAGRDTLTIKREADSLLPWVQTQGMGNDTKGAVLVGISPGFARLLKPRYAAGAAYLWHGGRWNYAGSQVLPLEQLLK